MSCKPEAIIEGKHFCISLCTGCDRFGLCYNNIMMRYGREQFESFSSDFSRINFNKYAVIFPDQQERIIINTMHPDIQINLKREEFLELQEVLQQVKLVLEARTLI